MIKKDIIKIFGILILVILQLSIFTKISFLNTIPNLIIILSIVLVFRGLLRDGLLVAIIGGIILDVYSPLHFGLFTILAFTTCIIVNYIILKNIPAPNLLLILLFFICLFLIINLIIILVTGLLPGWQILVDSVVNAFWGILVYFIAGKIIKPKEEIEFA